MRRPFVLPTLALCVVLCAPAVSSAHQLNVAVKVSPTEVRVEADYEGEDPVQDGAVTLTDANGVVVATGKTDDRGIWTCPRPSPGTYTVVVEQAGHRTKRTFDVPADGGTATAEPQRLDRRLGILLGLGVVLGASLLFKFARKKPATGGAS
jgi:hypothetical protein